MAKSSKDSKPTSSFSGIGDILKKLTKDIDVTITSEKKSKEFISTGVHMLNGAISGSIFGGIPTARITAIAGESSTGKSFIAYSICKQAQMKGYEIVYIDTEGSIDLDDLEGLGMDVSEGKFTLLTANKVEVINFLLTQFLDELKENRKKTKDNSKILIVLDSLGQLASNKEKDDLLNGKAVGDMTKAKAINSLFRSINLDLKNLEIPLIVCNHTYKTLDLFPQDKMKGGEGLFYSASVIGFLSKAKLKDDNADELSQSQNGIVVSFKCAKNRLAKPKKVKFEISFDKPLNPFVGLDFFLTPENFNRLGIGKGKVELDKTTGEEIFKPGGNYWYVRHLGKSVPTKNLFKRDVFTHDILIKIDEIAKAYFKYGSMEEIEGDENDNENKVVDFTNGFTDIDDFMND